MSIGLPLLHSQASTADWLAQVRQLHARNAIFLALWGSDDRPLGAGFTVRAAFLDLSLIHI